MDVGEVAASALVVVLFVALFFWIARRSWARNRYMYGRSTTTSAVIAALAVALYPLTVFYWLLGPTPERRRRSGFR